MKSSSFDLKRELTVKYLFRVKNIFVKFGECRFLIGLLRVEIGATTFYRENRVV